MGVSNLSKDRVMGKSLVVFALVGIAAIFGLFALTGCSSGGGTSTADYCGTWTCNDVNMSGQNVNETTKKMTIAVYKDATLEIKEDKTAALNVAGYKLDCTWEESSGGGIRIKASSDTFDCSIKGGKLVTTTEKEGVTTTMEWAKG